MVKFEHEMTNKCLQKKILTWSPEEFLAEATNQPEAAAKLEHKDLVVILDEHLRVVLVVDQHGRGATKLELVRARVNCVQQLRRASIVDLDQIGTALAHNQPVASRARPHSDRKVQVVELALENGTQAGHGHRGEQATLVLTAVLLQVSAYDTRHRSLTSWRLV